MLTDMTLGQYYPGHSYLHQMDPRAGIHLVQVRMAGIVLAEGHISEHVSYLPASLPFFLRLLRSFWPLPARGCPSLSGRGESA